MRNDGERDAIDRKLLALLEVDARASFTALAREAGLSRTAIQERMARLERDGVILGYTVRLADRQKTPMTRAMLSLRIRTRPCATVLDRFRNWPEILACYSLAGPVDAMLVVETEDAPALSALVDRLSAVPGVGEIETAPILAGGARGGRGLS
ncbi:Lrp/AsnC family transcriptional regulator [Bosea rubneri]|uniref:Lrp/AsnC family transcriptional regulator n=1 Tax=Bosea rubneri TaxID=3075434 RepID=A0ABU3SAA0_9HYPH|nr:Lrp/AsnC family transcriptional regulator [Bosea sp. ZW T0_25]MDU0341659.1 Lrp/AsnC family transcriptional regulator [Bosea sp. ZW T0_25]